MTYTKKLSKLNKKTLPPKYGLQHLYALSLFGQDSPMLSIGQAYKIYESIVVPDSIKVVYYPPFRQGFAVVPLPNNGMFKHIAVFGSRIFWHPEHNISTAVPHSSDLAAVGVGFQGAVPPPLLGIARLATLLIGCNQYIAIRASIILFNFLVHIICGCFRHLFTPPTYIIPQVVKLKDGVKFTDIHEVVGDT